MKTATKRCGFTMLAVVAGAALLAQAVPAGADTVELGLSRWVYARYNTATSAYAATQNSSLIVGRATRSLIAFDLTTLPDYQNINSLTLRLTLKTAANPVVTGVKAYAITQADGDWDVEWNQWNNIVINGEELFDATDNAVSAGSLGGHEFPDAWYITTFDITLSGTDLKALVDGWVGGNNAGFALAAYDESYGTSTATLYTTDAAGPATLIVDYTPVPEPATMAMLGLGGVAMLIRRRRSAA